MFRIKKKQTKNQLRRAFQDFLFSERAKLWKVQEVKVLWKTNKEKFFFVTYGTKKNLGYMYSFFRQYRQNLRLVGAFRSLRVLSCRKEKHIACVPKKKPFISSSRILIRLSFLR